MSANLDPMVYPLFFPRGDAGWHNQLVHNQERATLVRNNVTLSQYYSYKLSVSQFFSSLFYGKRVFHQYAVDVYVKIESFEDAMAIIKKYGMDLFITFTCNPKWSKITENLYPDQTANERPDLVIRVFKLKLNNLFNDIFKHSVLGKVVTHVQVIEFIYNM